MPNRTVHLICQAHIDPVWLWPWTAGVDEVLNTCASMCDFLDRHPEVIFTRGESWVYEQVRRHDPTLFRRIVRHIRAGRWSPVGGWFIQPDCNLPGEEGLHQQIELGRAWFEKHVGSFPRVAYNVDSFGHTAALPEIMRAHGQDCYVFMRPMKEERALPSRVFRWRGYAGEGGHGLPHRGRLRHDLPARRSAARASRALPHRAAARASTIPCCSWGSAIMAAARTSR